MYWNYFIQTCQTGDQLYSDTSPHGESSLHGSILFLGRNL